MATDIRDALMHGRSTSKKTTNKPHANTGTCAPLSSSAPIISHGCSVPLPHAAAAPAYARAGAATAPDIRTCGGVRRAFDHKAGNRGYHRAGNESTWVHTCGIWNSLAVGLSVEGFTLGGSTSMCSTLNDDAVAAVRATAAGAAAADGAKLDAVEGAAAATAAAAAAAATTGVASRQRLPSAVHAVPSARITAAAVGSLHCSAAPPLRPVDSPSPHAHPKYAAAQGNQYPKHQAK